MSGTTLGRPAPGRLALRKRTRAMALPFSMFHASRRQKPFGRGREALLSARIEVGSIRVQNPRKRRAKEAEEWASV